MAARKDLYNNLSSSMSNMSYLLDPSVSAEMPEELKIENPVSNGKDLTEKTVNIEDLVTFKDHPFHVDTDSENFMELVDSIRDNGLLYPVLARPVENKYEIISGHRRVAACKEVGMTEIPAIIRPMDDYDATILMVHSNFYREKISISEKAKAYRMCMDAEKHAGVKGVDTAAAIGKDIDSKRQVHRFIRLSYLSDNLLEYIDSGKMPVRVGVDVSYLDDAAQTNLDGFIKEYGIMPNMKQSEILKKKYVEENSLSYETIVAVLVTGLKKKSPGILSIKRKDIQEYFSEDVDNEYIHDVIIKLLQKYKSGEIGEL